MPAPKQNWFEWNPSRFPWEQDALAFVRDGFPASEHYRAWSNLEFIAEDGSINEIDLLVVCPQGFFLIEIKSQPGTLGGDAFHWTWAHEGRRCTVDHPLLLANLKCKRLKSLLSRQMAFQSAQPPYLEPLIFVSHPEARCTLKDEAAYRVRLRDREAEGATPARPGIRAALSRRECPGLRATPARPLDLPAIQAVVKALEQAGIKSTPRTRRVGDFRLESLIYDSPNGTYQDWLAQHASMAAAQPRVARVYLVATRATAEQRRIVQQAAEREFGALDRLDHPAILKADAPSQCELGPVLFFRREPDAVRLDHYLASEGERLPVDFRLDLLRQIAEAIQHAHHRKILHRSLSPQSILVRCEASGRPRVQVFNWQTGVRLAGTGLPAPTQISATLHASQLVEDASLVYLAPEALAGAADGATEMDIFSLGALAYLLFSGKPPASSITELREKLRLSPRHGLDLREALDGVPGSLAELVAQSANATPGQRLSIEDFLAGLDLVLEELTSADTGAFADPREAVKGSRLAGGFTVERRLGSGAVSVVYQVRRGGDVVVAKIANDPRHNDRLRKEYEVLRKLRDLQVKDVVRPFELLNFGDLAGFTMESAGGQTLAQRLREDEVLDLTLLERFGGDLLRILESLDSHGIAHRDIKPENIGVRQQGKGPYQLCLFDFSLSAASPEDIRVGTHAYLDPFIAERPVKRWDVSSELFSAAVTLHEMATGLRPVWGEGGDPASLSEEVTLRPSLFQAGLRENLVPFFARALRRDYRKRFDNPAEMRRAWSAIFKDAGTPPGSEHQPDPAALRLPAVVTPATQLILLGLSTRLANALDRLHLFHVADLLRYPLRKLYRLPGVGNKTRRELGELVKLLRERLPTFETEPTRGSTTTDPAPADGQPVRLDLLAEQLVTLGRGVDRVADQQILRQYLGWECAPGTANLPWPSQTQLAAALQLSRQRVGQALRDGRTHWARVPGVGELRQALLEILQVQGGLATPEELATALQASRGEEAGDPDEARQVSVAVRAAVEVEGQRESPRFAEFRSGSRVFLAAAPALKAHALALGAAADRLAAQDPLPGPAGVLAVLRDVPAPDFPPGVTPPGDIRLCQIAVAVSSRAALSSRLEIYPAGLAAKRALALAQNALFGGDLTVDTLRDRIAARYPRAQSLPARPELDALVEGLGLGIRWNPAAAGGRGAYQLPHTDSPSIFTSDTSPTHSPSPRLPALSAPVPSEVLEARALEEKLRLAAARGGFLALSAPPARLRQARLALTRRFPLDDCDADALFLAEMRRQADRLGVDWRVVLAADAALVGSPDWDKLQRLVDRSLPGVLDTLRATARTRLLVNPGLFARYDRLETLATFTADLGRPGHPPGLWLLLPANASASLPTLNHRALPLANANPALHAQITQTWLDGPG